MTLEELAKLKESNEYAILRPGHVACLGRGVTVAEVQACRDDRRLWLMAKIEELDQGVALQRDTLSKAVAMLHMLRAEVEELDRVIPELPPPPPPPAPEGPGFLDRVRTGLRELFTSRQELQGNLSPAVAMGAAARPAFKITERAVLKKFLGDGPPDRTDEPLETIVIEDGRIVSRTFKET